MTDKELIRKLRKELAQLRAELRRNDFYDARMRSDLALGINAFCKQEKYTPFRIILAFGEFLRESDRNKED